MKTAAVVACLLAVGLVPVLIGLELRNRGSDRAPASDATGPPPGPYRGSEPPPGLKAPDFVLASYRGNRVRMSALRGRVVLVTFLDTHCTTKCPLVASAVGDAMRLLAPRLRRKVSALAITVDPVHDTPATMRAFLLRRQALGALDFLDGTLAELRPIWRAFHVASAADSGNADVHSTDVRVFARDGAWVATLNEGADLTPANLAHDARVALNQRVLTKRSTVSVNSRTFSSPPWATQWRT